MILSAIISDQTVLTVTGSVMSFLMITIIGLITYIWNERKKQLEADREVQINFNKRLEAEIKSVQESHIHLEKSTSALEATVKSLTGWLKKVEDRYEVMFRTLHRLDEEVEALTKTQAQRNNDNS